MPSPSAWEIHLKRMWLVSSRPLLPFVTLPGVYSQTQHRTESQAAPTQGRSMVPAQTGRGFKGHSWLLDETRRSPGLPGVLCSRFVLKHRLHRCVPPTQASRGPGPAVGPQREGCRGSNSLNSLHLEVHENATSTPITRHYLHI